MWEHRCIDIAAWAAMAMATVLVLALAGLGVIGSAQAAQICSSAVVSDFNGDGLIDAAVGDPGQSVNGAAQAGVVHVRSGATAGRVGDGADSPLTQADIGETPEPGDRFGSVVKVGYVDGDTCADLVIGVPQEDIGTVADAGAVQVVFGAVEGLGKGVPAQILRQGIGGMPDTVEAGDQFGAAVDVSSLLPTRLEIHRLAIGVPGENVGTIADAGMTVSLGFAPAGNILEGRGIDQNTPDIPGAVEVGDRFGAAVAIWQTFSGSQGLVVGVPGEDLGTAADAGMVLAMESFSVSGTIFAEGITQDSDEIGGAAEAGDQLGASLAFLPGSDSFAVGVPGEDLTGVVDAGMVHVITGSPFFEQVGPFHQDVPGVADTAEAGDRFGSSLTLATLRYPTIRRTELAVGIPSEDRGTVADAGAVQEFGLDGFNSLATNVLIDQESLGGVSQQGEHFGASLAYTGEGDQPVLLAGTPDDLTKPAGLVYAIPRPINPTAPLTGLQIWTPGEGGIPAGGDSFGTTVAGVP